MSTRIAAIVVNWNGAALLPSCLPSISEGGCPVDILLIDNASSDESIEIARSQFPEVELILNSRNEGWARGNNIGIRQALNRGYEFVALFNTDARPARGWACVAEDVFNADERVGVVGFRLFEGRDPARDREFEVAAEQKEWTTEYSVDSITGAAMVLRCSALAQIGLIDETYFLYCEDLDLCERFRASGYRLARVSIAVRHLSEASSRRTPWRSAYLSMRNSLRLYLRWRGVTAALRHAWGVLRIAAGLHRLEDPDDIRHRYRPGGALQNIGLLAAALIWNIAHLRTTFEKRPRVTV